MKLKLHTIGSLALAAVFASACSDYLKEDSGDLLIPERYTSFKLYLTVRVIQKHLPKMWLSPI